MKTNCIFLFVLISFSAGAQSYVNNVKDTLSEIKTFYNVTMAEKTEFKDSYPSGQYFLILDVGVDQSKLNIKATAADGSPVLLNAYNGYYGLHITDNHFFTLKFDYEGQLQPSGLFAKMYWITPSLIGTTLPAEAKFKTNKGELSATEIFEDKTSLLVTLNTDRERDKEIVEVIKKLQLEYPEVQIIFYGKTDITDLESSAVVIKGSNLRKLSPWTAMIKGQPEIFMIDTEGKLIYKNSISNSKPITNAELTAHLEAQLMKML